MSLITCHECAKPVSTAAKACPNCGAPTKRQSSISQITKSQWTAIGWLAFLFLIWYSGFKAYDQWAEKKAIKKAETSEFMRRNSLTPEQRIAEDAAKAARQAQVEANQAYRAKLETEENTERPYKTACRVALTSTLNDPRSFEHLSDYGSIQEDGTYDGYIDGRAKNGFGALVLGTWKCTAIRTGSSVTVTGLEQIRPRIR